MVVGPRQMARVEITAARLAPEKMFGLTDALPIGALTEHRPARSRFIGWHDHCHQHFSKKIRPGIAPEAWSARRGYIRPRRHLNLYYRSNRPCQTAGAICGLGVLIRRRHRATAI
jgi:hypothetical protein